MTLHPFVEHLIAIGLVRDTRTTTNGHTPPPGGPPGGPPGAPPPGPGDPRGQRYAAAALAAECATVAGTGEGGRNHALNRAAFRVGQLVSLGYLALDAALSDLLDAAHRAGLPAAEAWRTAHSGLRAGLDVPRAGIALHPQAPPVATAIETPHTTSGGAAMAASVVTVEPSADLTQVGQSANPQVSRLIPGGVFIHSAPSEVPAIWGRDDEVLWAAGEPLLITGPTGVGKTTLGGMVLAGRLGLLDTVLDYPVTPGERRTLVLAMDRPAQIQRALARLLRAWPAELLDQRLAVWKGPPPSDLARHPHLLLALAQQADADTVIIDSLKDAAVKLSDEETGQGLARAMNLCVANGVEVLGYHHQTKRGGGGLGKPNSLADVYGSGWITASVGSVLLLWGNAGDPVVELSHLKQPAGDVGPVRIIHDHITGHSSLLDEAEDPLLLLSAGPQTASAVTSMLHGTTDESAVAKVRRRLDGFVRKGLAIKVDEPMRGGVNAGHRGGSRGGRYALAPAHKGVSEMSEMSNVGRPTASPVSAGRTTDGLFAAPTTSTTDGRPTASPVSAGRTTDVSTVTTDALRPTPAPPSKGGGPVAVDGRNDPPNHTPQQCPRCRQTGERLVTFPPALGEPAQLCVSCAYPDPSTRPGAEPEDDS